MTQFINLSSGRFQRLCLDISYSLKKKNSFHLSLFTSFSPREINPETDLIAISSPKSTKPDVLLLSQPEIKKRESIIAKLHEVKVIRRKLKSQIFLEAFLHPVENFTYFWVGEFLSLVGKIFCITKKPKEKEIFTPMK